MNDLIAAGDNILDELGSDARAPTSLKISELDFTDLYISETGEVRIRGLKDAQGPLVSIPSEFIRDVDRVHRMVTSKGASEDEFSIDYDSVRYRVTKIDAQQSTWYTLRRLMHPIPRFQELGFNPLVVQELGKLGKRPGNGLVLVAGATGNGKTTTSCSLLQAYLHAYGDMAVTIEDPPELRLEGPHGRFGYCLQNRVKDRDFTTPLRSALRQNPRYILLGEIRDPDAASEALRAAISGHVVISTIHAGSIREAIVSILKLVSSRLDLELARHMIADGLSAVVHQEMKLIKATDGRTTRRPFIKTLFMGDEGLRAKLRGGQVQLIDTDIEQQASRIANNKPPYEPGKKK